ncbi:MAG: hypothetical protein WBA13_11790 [Microcoleaceae cyanobacterium]
MLKYRNTIGWSLISSGLTTLLLKVLPGDSLLWGVGFLAVGTTVFLLRQTEITS